MLPREDANLLGLSGAALEEPVLSVLRLTFSSVGERVEWRQRYCLSRDLALLQKAADVACRHANVACPAKNGQQPSDFC
jgi:hypothetical protein